MELNVYQHFRPNEHPFIDLISEWQEQAIDRYAPFLTDFLDPRQAYILETLVRQRGEISVSFEGGYQSAERKRALLYPDYLEPQMDDFELSLCEINYPHKFGTLSHGKILGTLLSTGVKRDAFGDIVSDGLRWQVWMKKEMLSYIMMQVHKIGSLAVRLEEKTSEEAIIPKEKWLQKQTTLSSLRLDNVVASTYNISRQQAKQLIEAGRVKVNWTESLQPDFKVDLLDVISVRKFGRIQLKEVLGKTKKDKYRVQLGVLRK